MYGVGMGFEGSGVVLRIYSMEFDGEGMPGVKVIDLGDSTLNIDWSGLKEVDGSGYASRGRA